MNERFIRQLWRQQTFRGELRTTSSSSISVIRPGVHNLDSGPDFLDALVEIDGRRFRGDIEVHASNNLWLTHKHHLDPKYNSVILHAVMEMGTNERCPFTESGRKIPVFVMSGFLSTKLRTLWKKIVADDRVERRGSIPCDSRNREISSTVIRSMLDRTGRERLELKIRRQHERLRDIIDQRRFGISESSSPYEVEMQTIPPASAGITMREYSVLDDWEQLLYEGMAEVLGYSKNSVPFLRLTRSLRLKTLKQFISLFPGLDPSRVIAGSLFGAAGLIGDPMPPSLPPYVHEALLDVWGNISPLYSGKRLHRSEWTFFRLRPANFPTYRLMTLALITARQIHSGGFLPRLVETVKDGRADGRGGGNMIRFLAKDHAAVADPPGERFFRSVGRGRAIDAAVNLFVPTLFLYARLFHDRPLRGAVLAALGSLPRTQENSITRLMERRLLRKRVQIQGPLQQQALIQLYKFYCSQERCTECKIGNAAC